MTSGATVTSVTTSGGVLNVSWADGASGSYAAIWLRDNLPQVRDAHSGQRLIDVTDLPLAPQVRHAALAGTDVRIEWVDDAPPATYAVTWLRAYALGEERYPERVARHWIDGAQLDAGRDFGSVALAELAALPAVRLGWLTRLLKDGLAFLVDVPRTEEGILTAMAHVGRVAETNYGLVFDVRAVPAPENLAYSDLGLGLHTDNPYRDPVPGFQALHALVTAPDGGDNLFVDGWALAEYLRASDARSFDTLTRTPVPFRYRSPDADLYAQRPLIELACDGVVSAVNYNNRSIAPLRAAPAECERFYAAYRAFAALLREPRFQLRHRLAPGELVVFDNRRILHGRTGYASARHARHLRGCYLTRDSVYSETAVLRARLVQTGA
jgi:gamma-butyrobetaine dioxygenase